MNSRPSRLLRTAVAFAMFGLAFPALATVAVFTCSCDPPTRAHLAIIEAAARSPGVDKVYVYINASGTKAFKTSAAERLEMVRAGLPAGLSQHTELAPIDQAAKNWVIRNLESQVGGDLVSVIGEDSYAALPASEKGGTRRWLVVPRDVGGSGPELGPNAKVLNLEGLAGISSTELRRQLESGDVSPSMTAPAIQEMIARQRMYTRLPPALEAVQKNLYESGFAAFVDRAKRQGLLNESTGNSAPYDPLMTRESWPAQWIAWALDRAQPAPEATAGLRQSLEKLLYETRGGRRVPKDFTYLNKDPIKSTGGEVAAVRAQLPPRRIDGNDFWMDIDTYALERFPEPVRQLLRQDGAAFIHDGPIAEIEAIHARDGFTEFYSLAERATGQRYQRYLAFNPDSRDVRLVLPTFGQDNVERLVDQLNVGVTNPRIVRVTHENKALPFDLGDAGSRQRFDRGDLLVMGLQRRIRELILTRGDWTVETIGDGTVEILSSPGTPYRIINTRIQYGDISTTVLEHFYNLGVRRFLHLGTAGTIKAGFKVGDVLAPMAIQDTDGTWVPYRNSHAHDAELKGVKLVKHGWINSVLAETKSRIQSMESAGVESLDVEGIYFAKFAERHADAKVGSVLIVSDDVKVDTYDRLTDNFAKVEASLADLIDTAVLQRLSGCRGLSDGAAAF